jgi:hypothetical protein
MRRVEGSLGAELVPFWTEHAFDYVDGTVMSGDLYVYNTV